MDDSQAQTSALDAAMVECPAEAVEHRHLDIRYRLMQTNSRTQDHSSASSEIRTETPLEPADRNALPESAGKCISLEIHLLFPKILLEPYLI